MSVSIVGVDLTAREPGYHRNPDGISNHDRDIMRRAEFEIGDDVVQWRQFQVQMGGLPHNNQMSFTESLVQGNVREQTFMQMLRPEDSAAGKYRADKIDTKSLQRDVDKPITD